MNLCHHHMDEVHLGVLHMLVVFLPEELNMLTLLYFVQFQVVMALLGHFGHIDTIQCNGNVWVFFGILRLYYRNMLLFPLFDKIFWFWKLLALFLVRDLHYKLQEQYGVLT